MLNNGRIRRREFLKSLTAASLMTTCGISAPFAAEQDGSLHKEDTKMGKKLENLRSILLWVSYIRCIKGCLDYLKMDVSTAWLFGATGHAFIINIPEGLDVSGPTALNYQEMFFSLGENIGYKTNIVSSFKSDGDFAEKQKLAWEKAKQAIDQGLPCYGWNLDTRFPEFYVVHGYDDVGYYFCGPGANVEAGPKPWQELGSDRIGWLGMHWLESVTPADDVTTVKEAFEFVLKHADNPKKWVFSGYRSGLAAFDLWIHELETGRANGHGVGMNAGCWGECRDYAVDFLMEARDRIGGDSGVLFDEAISHYEVVAANMGALAGIFPFDAGKPWHIKDKARIGLALDCLRRARSAEESGLGVLEKIINMLR